MHFRLLEMLLRVTLYKGPKGNMGYKVVLTLINYVRTFLFLL